MVFRKFISSKQIFAIANFYTNERISARGIRCHSLRLNLLLQDILQGHGVGRELGDTLTELLDGHGLLVELEAEQSLILEVAALGDVEAAGSRGVKLLGDGVLGVVQILEQTGLEYMSVMGTQDE